MVYEEEIHNQLLNAAANLRHRTPEKENWQKFNRIFNRIVHKIFLFSRVYLRENLNILKQRDINLFAIEHHFHLW